jgi:ribose-phosphate pyrophosphokinase
VATKGVEERLDDLSVGPGRAGHREVGAFGPGFFDPALEEAVHGLDGHDQPVGLVLACAFLVHQATLGGMTARGIGTNHRAALGVWADVRARGLGDHRRMPVTPPLLLPLPGFEPLAAASGLEIVPPRVEHFDNGEFAIRLPQAVEGRDCFLLGTAAPPADQLVSLLLAADSLARHGARSVHALLPYLAYARQDRLEAGRSLAAGWLGAVLAASGVDDVVAIDVHSEAARSLMGLPVTSLSPSGLFARELSGVFTSDAVVVAPDQGALERSRALADRLGVDRPIVWLEKERKRGGVTHRRLVGELADRAIVVDDILDTGGTLVSCCRELRARGVRQTTIAVTHGLFTGWAWRELAELNVRTIHVTDSVPGARALASELVRVHSVGPLLATALAWPGTASAWKPVAHVPPA